MPRKTVRNKITSDEKTEKINKANKDLMNRFLKYKAIKVSPNTIKVYDSNLLIFFTWNLIHNENKHFVEIKKLEFSNFFYFASEELELGSSRLNNLRSTLSSFSSFIEKFYDEEYPDFRNVILNVVESAPKEVRREKTILTDEQIDDLLDYLSARDSQQACWLALAICSGARFSELLRFKTDLIDEERTAFGDVFLETTRKIKTKGRGKSGKLLYKYIFKEKFLPYYRVWLEERKNILKENEKEHEYLFVKENGKPITGTIVRGWLEDFENYLGVPVYAHAFRHYLATMLSKKNVPQNAIKEIFGWSSLEMVNIYDDSSAKDREYEELKNLKL
jgi:site-specific recombinase XerD